MKNEHRIDLRSDTCSQPSEEMRKVIYSANVGDQAYGEDSTTKELEDYCASLFGKEKALFMPSGTMSDQVALRIWTNPGEEVILDESYHLNYFQASQSLDLGKVNLSTIKAPNGFMTPELITEQLTTRMKGDHFSPASLISLENTINSHSGKVYPFGMMKAVYDYSREQNMAVHIDGERIMNACARTGILPKEYGNICDSISCSFSKGLGAPFGSILMSDEVSIKKAERFRRWYGGHLHQSGFMASAALYAIKNNISRLKEDHYLTEYLFNLLRDVDHIDVQAPETNILMLNISKLKMNSEQFVQKCAEMGVLAYPWRANEVRFVVHLNISLEDIITVGKIVRGVVQLD